jgi:hypothetical protein
VDIITHANELARRAELGTGGFGHDQFSLGCVSIQNPNCEIRPHAESNSYMH